MRAPRVLFTARRRTRRGWVHRRVGTAKQSNPAWRAFRQVGLTPCASMLTLNQVLCGGRRRYPVQGRHKVRCHANTAQPYMCPPLSARALTSCWRWGKRLLQPSAASARAQGRRQVRACHKRGAADIKGWMAAIKRLFRSLASPCSQKPRTVCECGSTIDLEQRPLCKLIYFVPWFCDAACSPGACRAATTRTRQRRMGPHGARHSPRARRARRWPPTPRRRRARATTAQAAGSSLWTTTGSSRARRGPSARRASSRSPSRRRQRTASAAASATARSVTHTHRETETETQRHTNTLLSLYTRATPRTRCAGPGLTSLPRRALPCGALSFPRQRAAAP